MDEVQKSAKEAHDFFYVNMMELAAIWLQNEPIVVNGKIVVRVAPGQKIAIKEEKLVRAKNEPPTHQVLGCYGNVRNTKFELKAIDLKSGEEQIIKL